MPLIVEDGSGVVGAESYISVADADDYHAKRNNLRWTGTEPEKEGALRKATDYIRQYYRTRWKGAQVYVDQGLDWPRSDVYIDPRNLETLVGDDVVPVEVVNATAELALIALRSDLAPSITKGQKKRVKIGPIETEYENNPVVPIYRSVAMLLNPYLLPSVGGSTVDLVRA